MRKTRIEDEFSVVVVTADMNKEKNQQKTVILEDEREGKDEMNLVELPFALISNRNSQKVSTIERRWAIQEKNGKTKNCYEIITGSNKRGLPTFQAEQVTIAALALTFRKQAKDPKIRTTQYEMCSLLHWPYTSQYRKQLRDMFSLLKGITIETNHFYNAKTGKHEWAVFGIMDNAHFSQEEGYFKWNEDFWNALQLGHIKQLDTGIYFSLKRNLSKRLFRYADRHIYNGRGHEIDLKRLCYDKLLMMGAYHGTSGLIQKLQPAIDEINGVEQNGFQLMQISIAKSKNTPSGKKVVFEKARKSRQSASEALGSILEQGSAETAPEANFEALEAVSADDQTTKLTSLLIERGVRPKPAADLVKTYPHRIEQKIEEYDWIKMHEPKRIKKWVKGDAPGFLVDSIKENYDSPSAFVSLAELEERARVKKQAEQELVAEYLTQKEQVIGDIDATMKLSDEQRVKPMLGAWETTQRKLRKAPTPEEKKKRQARYIKNLPSREKMIDQGLRDLRMKFEQRAAEQGIEHFDANPLP